MDLKFDKDATDDDEFVQKERMPFKEAVQMIHSGEINDGKTICCLLRAAEYLKKLGRI